MGDFSLLLYLFIPSFTYISKSSWMFILFFGLYANTTLVCYSNCSSFGNQSSFGQLMLLFNLLHYCVPPVALSCVFLIPIIELTISPERPVYLFIYFYWRITLGTENQMLVVLIHCYWDIFASRPSQLTEQGNKYVYTNSCICTDVQMLLYLQLHQDKYKFILMSSATVQPTTIWIILASSPANV